MRRLTFPATLAGSTTSPGARAGSPEPDGRSTAGNILVDLGNAVIADAVSHRLESYGYTAYTTQPLPREPDIIIVDSTTVGNKTAERYPRSRVLLLETNTEINDVGRAILFHTVQGIISRTTKPGELKKALVAITEGRVWIDNSVIRDFLADAGLMSGRSQLQSFTPHEKKVVDCICRGETNKEIAQKLHISLNTVKAHLRHIMTKAGAVNRSHLASLFASRPGAAEQAMTETPRPERSNRENATAHQRILIVEDEATTSLDIRQRLLEFGYEPLGPVASGDDAVASALSLHPDVVLMDIILKGSMNGIQAAEAIRARSRCPVIYVTGNSDRLTVDSANVTQPFGLVLKPIDERELHAAIEKALWLPREDPPYQSDHSVN
jgi:DNA-binding NarL/FixJ family response regulator